MLNFHGDIQPVLRVSCLCKDYGATRAVDNVSFDIQAGRILGVVGPNGAGKTTIVKVITGLTQPTRGEVLFCGEPVVDQRDRYLSSMGYVPEQSDLYGFLTGWEYLEMVCGLRGLPPRLFRTRGLALFEALRLADARHRRIGSYSKGMRQRVVLIAALIHNPAFLVLDEPFSGLDVTSCLILRRVIELLAGLGKAIFFCSPSLEHLEQVSTDLLVLRSGVIVAAGSPDEIKHRFGGGNLATGFLQLAEAPDTDLIARSVVEAACAI